MHVQRLIRLAGTVVLAGCLSACSYVDYFSKSTHDYGSRQKNDPKMIRVRSHGSLTADRSQHNNKYFEYSSALSNKISSLPGINTALVFLTDKNAYVGITTDWSATGTKARGGNARREQNNGGTMNGYYNQDTGGLSGDNRQVANRYNSYFTHKDVSDLSAELRQTIGDTIRRSSPRVQEVHISANREYVNQLLEFAKASWAGQSLDRMTPAFNRLVRYVFALGHEIPLPLHEYAPHGDSPGGAGPEPTAT